MELTLLSSAAMSFRRISWKRRRLPAGPGWRQSGIGGCFV